MTDQPSWYVVRGVNPEPWAIGPLGLGRNGGKVYPYIGPNAQLANYKLAIKEAMTDFDAVVTSEPVKLEFFFWRRLDTRKHPADSTNLQKALEDALQGVLYQNDKQVTDIRSRLVMQQRNIEPLIVISIRQATPLEKTGIPSYVLNAFMNREPAPIISTPPDFKEEIPF